MPAEFTDKRFRLGDKANLTPDKDGYLAVEATIARTGIQDYWGYEVGKPELGLVRVLRPDESVMLDQESLRSFPGAPITVDHPPGGVDARNYKEEQVGFVGTVLRRDGDYIVAPLMIRDESAVKTVLGGTREVSMGYDCDIEWKSGTTEDGQKYDAIQRNIRINHLAIVKDGRAGGAAIKDQEKEQVSMKKITVDGITIEVADDAAEQVINKALADAKAKKDELEAENKQLKADAAKADAEKTALSDQKKELEDKLAAASDPKAIADQVKARSAVVDKATKIAPKLEIADGSSTEQIIEDTVVARKGAEFVADLKARHGDNASIALQTMFDTFAEDAGSKSTTTTTKTQDGGGSATTADAARQAFHDKWSGKKTAQDKE